MGFGVSLVTFSPNSTIKSADVNNNFSNLNNATDFQGNWDTATSGVSLYLSDETVDSQSTIHMKPSPASPARTVTIGSRDGSGVMHPGLYVDLSGNVKILSSLQFPSSSGMSRFGGINGSGSGTYNHNFGVTPTKISGAYAGNFGTAPSQDIAYYNQGTSQVTVAAQSGYSWTIVLFA